jgi:putative hydrolase of the HAD superfamily
MLSAFRAEVKGFHAKEKTVEKPFPEIDILKIWEDILTQERNKGMISFHDPLCIKCFTFVFEMLSNRIYPMPGMHEVLQQLQKEGYPLGIISNAQFYTPLIMNYFLNGTLSESETVPPFDPDLTLFSYMHRRSKPDPALFRVLEDQCAGKYGLRPDEIVYIGNDMYRDVFPAKRAGMKTVLFAGDKKSLRLRKDLPELNGIKPDYIITELMQLMTLLKR